MTSVDPSSTLRCRSEAGIGAKVGCAVLFADLVGFTKMSTRLSADDPRGAERVHDALNPMIAAVVDRIDDAGGRTIGLFGDAVLALWPRGMAAQARLCAHDLEEAVRSAVPRGHALTLRVALDAGPVERIPTPGGAVYWGPALDRLRSTAATGTSGVSETGTFTAACSAEQTAVLPPDWRVEPPEGDRLWSAEIRTTTALFVQAGGAAPEESQVRRLTDLGAQAAARFSGRLLQAGTEDKGLLMLLGWGLPGTVPEEDADLAIAAAKWIRGAVAKTELRPTCSIARGRAFCGVLGGRNFGCYTMLGRHVNIAAGALKAAGGGLVCDAATRDASQRHTFGTPRSFTDKSGEFRHLFTPDGTAARVHRFDTPLIGRDDILARLLRFADGHGAEGARGRLVWLTGEAGLGKSHLLAEVRRRMGRNRPLVQLAGDRLQQLTSYLIWQPAFALCARSLPPGHGEEMAALLNPVIPGFAAETDASRALSPLSKAQKAEALMADTLARGLQPELRLVVIEDAHWMDSASWRLLSALRERRPDLRILIASRPISGDSLSEAASEQLMSPSVEAIILDALDPVASEQLIAQTLGAHHLPPGLADRIGEHVAGHPLYTVQVVSSLRESGAIAVTDGHAHLRHAGAGLRELAFPDGIESAIAARMARMDMHDQMLLKVASVQGRRFNADLVDRLMPSEMRAPSALGRSLERAAADGLIEPLDDSATWQFQHAVIRQTAYDLLTRTQAQRLHEGVARALEAEPAAKSELLAYHWSRTGDAHSALPWLDAAARAAHAANASHEALDFVDQAVAFSDRVPPSALAPATRITWFRIGSAAALTLGDHDRSERYSKAILAATGRRHPRGTASNVMRAMCEVVAYRLKQTRPLGKEDVRKDRMHAAISAHLALSEVYYDRKDTLGVVVHTVSAMNLARRLEADGRDAALANANMAMLGLHAPALAQGRPHLDRALHMAHDLDDATAARILIIAGNFEIGSGCWQAGRDALHRSADLAQAARHLRWEMMALASLANLARLQGHMLEADATDARVDALARDRGVNQVQIWALTGRIKSLLSLNDFEGFEAAIARDRALLSDDENWQNASFNSHVALPLCTGMRALQEGRREEGVDQIVAAARLFGGERQLQTFSIDLAVVFTDALQLMACHDVPVAVRRRLGRMLHKRTRALAGPFAPARPLVELTWGDEFAINGRTAAARAAWGVAETMAAAADMPYLRAAAAHRLHQAGEAVAADRRDAALARAGTPLPRLWTG